MKRIKICGLLLNVDEEGYINMLFLSSGEEHNLYFDGINFYKIKAVDVLLKKLSIFDYDYSSSDLYIERITQDFDMYFIAISNGDVFQIYSMFNDEKESQVLTIFDKKMKSILIPLGISIYEAALKRVNGGEEVEIIVKDI